jgi:hypothetical protein
MNGRDFLTVAGEVIRGTTAAHWRTAVGRAYYALFLEGREALLRWGFPPAARDRSHLFVRLCFVLASDPDLKDIGRSLEWLGQRRNDADYTLRSPHFASVGVARRALRDAHAALAILDAIDADPVRRAAAIADINSRPLP